MITLKESILDKDFDVDVADKYRGDNGEIRVEDYETFQFWLADQGINFEVLDLKDKRNQFGHDAKCIICISPLDKVNNKVSLIYTFIRKGEYFWQYFIGNDLVYDHSSSCDLYSGDSGFKMWVQKRLQPIKYFKEKIKKAEQERKKCLKPKRDRRTGDYSTDYYGAQLAEARAKRFEAILDKMK